MFRHSLIALSALVSIYGSAHATMWGVATYSSFGTQSLYQIDTLTGSATAVGSTGLTQINGLAFDATLGRMFATTTSGELHLISLQTGQSLLIADSNTIVPEGDIAFLNGLLYSVNGNRLVTVNTQSGSLTTIGDLGLDASDVSGLTADGLGRLLGYSKNGTLEDTLVSIDPFTGLATTIGSMGINTVSAVGGLAFDPSSGQLFLTDGATLYTVNSLTGAATQVGPHGLSGFSGLSIPAPASSVVMAVGLLGCRRRRSRSAV